MRDNGECQYCGRRGNTIDHVRPRSKGGVHRWENVVLCCTPCNQRKGDALLEDLGWTLRNEPTVPKRHGQLVLGFAKVEPAWEPHLAAWA